MNIGLRVMFSALAGHGEDNGLAIRRSIDKVIQTIAIVEDAVNHIDITFDDGSILEILDDGQSCCESRYITTDDDLKAYTGERFRGVQLKGYESIDDSYGNVHEKQFLEVQTDRSCCTFCTHNRHNGYYGGFALVAKYHGAKHGEGQDPS